MKVSKNNIALFYLIFFLGLKVISLHTFTHDESTINCETCEFVLNTNEVPFLKEDTIRFEIPIEYVIEKDPFCSYSFSPNQELINYTLFSRPPPLV